MAAIVFFVLILFFEICFCLVIENDGIDITVINPAPDVTLVSPISVALSLDVSQGVGADAIRRGIESYRICYAMDGDRPPKTVALHTDNDKWEELPLLHDPRLKPGTSHMFEVWIAHISNLHVETYGYKKHTFFIKQRLSTHQLRMNQWNHNINMLLTTTQGIPTFIEIGTSFFNTLAHEHSSFDGWLGVSVEPIQEYLNMLPIRKGLSKVNAMVCPDNDERIIYTFQGLEELGLDTFFHGMSSSDPTHAWKAPELRTRVDLDTYRSLLTNRSVPCVTYGSLLQNIENIEQTTITATINGLGKEKETVSQQTRLVLAHLKVDAEGADVGIVRAAIHSANQTCAWPWRIDFEAVHAAAISPPKSFKLAGFESLLLYHRSLNEAVFVKMKQKVNGANAYQSESGDWIISFLFKMGHWVIQSSKELQQKIKEEDEDGIRSFFTLNQNVIVHTNGKYVYAVPWENRTEWMEPNEQNNQLKIYNNVFVTDLVTNPLLNQDDKPEERFYAHGESEKLLSELEDIGYACNCADIDCSCFTNPTRIAIYHPSCGGVL